MQKTIKYKVTLARIDRSTIHGVLFGIDRQDALGKLKLSNGVTLTTFEEVATNQACFYDSEFDTYTK